MQTLANAQLWVLDQDEALAFYVDKLGWTKREDLSPPELGGFRWLSVAPSADADTSVVLMAIPGEPIIDEEAAKQLRALMDRGVVSAIFLTATDVHATYEDLKSRGVPFDAPPTEQPWGIDCAFRDPSGNNFRLAQLAEVPAAA